MIEYWPLDDFQKKIYKKDYILNGIRVLNKYLFPSFLYMGTYYAH